MHLEIEYICLLFHNSKMHFFLYPLHGTRSLSRTHKSNESDCWTKIRFKRIICWWITI